MMLNIADRLRKAISERRRRIVVIGDTMTDRWVHGHLDDCQDGCQKFVQEEVVETPGGAANAERCLREWVSQCGITTSLYGFAENDRPVKTRFVDGDHIVFRHDDDGDCAKRGADYGWAQREALEMCHHAGGVLLSDYDKGFLTPGFIEMVVEVCQKRGVPCVADCKRGPEIYEGCILKSNSDWWVKHGGSNVVTDGHNPPMVVGTNGMCGDLPPVDCINHVGAGDCFAAHLTLALAYEFSLKEAAQLAHSAGRVYVQHPLNRPPHPHEVAADMSAGVVQRETISTSTP